MIRKVLSAFLIMLVSILIFLFFKIGAYKSVAVEKTTSPQLELYYTEVVGPYHEIILPLKKVEGTFKDMDQPCPQTFGHFLSDPEIVEHDKLVSHVGCAYPAGQAPQFITMPEGVEQKYFGQEKQGKVCYKGTFKGSPSLTAMKVYPKLKQQALRDKVKLNFSSSLEVYTVDDKSVTTEVYLCE